MIFGTLDSQAYEPRHIAALALVREIAPQMLRQCDLKLPLRSLPEHLKLRIAKGQHGDIEPRGVAFAYR